MRERFEAVEIPLNSTNQSQNARHGLFELLLICPRFSPRDIGFAGSEEGASNRRCPSTNYGRCFGSEFAPAFLDELEIPKLIRKKRKPLRSESRSDMGNLLTTIPQSPP